MLNCIPSIFCFRGLQPLSEKLEVHWKCCFSVLQFMQKVNGVTNFWIFRRETKRKRNKFQTNPGWNYELGKTFKKLTISSSFISSDVRVQTFLILSLSSILFKNIQNIIQDYMGSLANLTSNI